MRSNHRRAGQDLSFAGKQTKNPSMRIAPKTASLVFEPCKAFFCWAKAEEGLIDANPAQDVRFSFPKNSKTAKSRRPFTADELAVLFSAPIFSGYKSYARPFEKGSCRTKDGRYWLPLLGFYTGARLGELVQLHLSDIDVSATVPYLEINDTNSGTPGTATAKSVKSAAGVRRVPLHPHLLELGFAKFVQTRQLSKKQTRLFWDIKMGADGQASTAYSKWFARMLDRVGLTDPALVFHSFRHNAEDALRDALQPQYVIDRIIGHSDGATSAQYGNGVSIEVALAAVEAMKLKYDVRGLLKPMTSTG